MLQILHDIFIAVCYAAGTALLLVLTCIFGLIIDSAITCFRRKEGK